MLTDYHAKYFAHDLTRQASRAGLERLSMALFDANVDLNPHQIEAALFALRSPLTKGVILADEVGLGKTIEASLVLCQFWAERKRKLLVICPAAIRKQWANELEEKFNLPSTILDSRSYSIAKRAGAISPFDCGKVVICSLNFAAKMKDDIRAVGWNLVIIDEAHKLRNAHQPSNKTGQAIRFAVEHPMKILLTATPLQNSLMELYGMSSVIDEYMFGEPSVFRSLYTGADADLNDLKTRLKGFCKRTLRKDVLEYVQYTQRQAITRPFRPTDDEHTFYEAISTFLQRDETFSIPKRQRVLLTLRLRKILASSSPAIAGTLEVIKQRLTDLKAGIPEGDLVDKIIAGEDVEEELFFEESLDYDSNTEDANNEVNEADIPIIDAAKLDAEIAELDQYIRWARGIGVDTKSRSLLNALDIGFNKMQQNGAARKALIFTESRRTQTYLRNFLEANGHAGKHDVVVINFVNERNAADQRTFELLEEKFQLFDGVFGASDDVLGSIESGVDFEKRIYEIYQSCRTTGQIEAAFLKLREQLDASIQARMASTRQMLLEFFDEEIHQRLRLQLEGARQQLDRFGKQFWMLTRHLLASAALFDDAALTFQLNAPPAPDIEAGTYHLISKQKENVEGKFLYRLSHPLGEHVVDVAKALVMPIAQVDFDISHHPTRLSVVEDLKGQSGWMTLDKIIIDAFEREEYILLSGFTDAGVSVDQEVFEKVFLCSGVVDSTICDLILPERLAAESVQRQKATMHQSLDANNRFMNEERERLEKWADDMILSAEKELKDIKAQLREANRLSRQASTTEEQLKFQSKIRDLEQRQRRQRQRIFEIEDEIIEKRNLLIGALEKRMKQKTHTENLFTIRWRIV